jgi:AAA15 family ATPase/GTPase
MKIGKIKINNFKRFSDLTIENIPESAKLVLLVGPNGCGKTSLFDAFYHWYRLWSNFGVSGDKSYFLKTDVEEQEWARHRVGIELYDKPDEIKGKFYFRTAYRNEPTFNINKLTRQNDPTKSLKLENLIYNDVSVSENYQRLISLTLSGVYNTENDKKTIEEFRDELIGRIRDSLKNVFEDLTLTSIGDPLSNGSFYFQKGTSVNFHYKNLSGGEKSVFDIILDLIIKSEYYPEAIFCIDEPEAHMHTKLQSALLKELYRLIPDRSQLWLSTHSLGMLRQAREIEETHPSSVVFLNFDNLNFDETVTILPSRINKTIWNKFIEIALDSYSSLIAPSTIVFCEGTQAGRKYKNFDAQIYSIIFAENYPDTSFISVGSSSELENVDNPSITLVKNLLKDSEIIKLVDKDDKSPGEIEELNNKAIKVLGRRHIESYLLDDEIIYKLCEKNGKSELFDTCKEIKSIKLKESMERGNPADDIKSASGEIYIELKRLLGLWHSGNTKDAFFRDTMAPLISPETNIYKELEKEIFK